jgi:DNA (cytosine-5)-methyltransferase 1
MKVLNLYASLGGNRYLWQDCQVTAVELDQELARMYQERFPKDKVIIADAHQYLLDHFKEFDFIWSSPPCPSHSGMNYFLHAQGTIRYPDMKLYEEIIFLQHFFKGKYCVENVIPYYRPLIPAQQRGRHLYWTNFQLPKILSFRKSPPITAKRNHKKNIDAYNKLCEFHKIDLCTYKGKQAKRKLANNLVDYEAGNTIFETARKSIFQQNSKTLNLFI